MSPPRSKKNKTWSHHGGKKREEGPDLETSKWSLAEERPAQRLFVAATLPTQMATSLANLVESMQPTARTHGIGVRWVATTHYHITLRYLGWTRRPAIEAITDRLSQVLTDCRSFSIAVSGVGAFASQEKARVLWARIQDGHDKLAELAGLIDREMNELGFACHPCDYRAHITIGRLAEPTQATALILPFSRESLGRATIQRVVLFDSIDEKYGVVYRPVQSWQLATA